MELQHSITSVATAAPTNTRLALRKRRRFVAALVLLAPGLMSLASDVLHRGHRIAAFDVYHGATYLGAAVESFLIGSLLLMAPRADAGFGVGLLLAYLPSS